MMRYLREKTVIIVTHRLQTVKAADRIVVLEDGKIVQQGRFNELLSIEGEFRQLWEKQASEN